MTPLDRVVTVEAGRRAVAVRHVPQTLEVFATHFPRFPVLPGVLILDDAAAVARLALAEPASPARWRLAAARRVRYRHFVEPGDAMEIDVQVVDRDARTAACRATVRVDGRPVTTVGELRLERLDQEENQ